MATFPKSKDEMMILLGVLLNQAVGHISDRQQKEAEAQGAVKLENESVTAVGDEARRLLRLAEALYRRDAGALHRLGWNVRAEKRRLKPGQVTYLEVGEQGPGTVALHWKPPKPTAATGRVGFYRIERQIRDLETNHITEEWGTWAATSSTNTIHLENQPRLVELSYRIVAVNHSGDGEHSDTETAVL